MKTTIVYGIGTFAFLGLSLIASANSDTSEVTYNYLPKSQMVGKVVATLAQHGINTDQVYIQANEFGVVNLTGEVASKEAADLAVDVTKNLEGVYALDTTLVYPAEETEPTKTSAL